MKLFEHQDTYSYFNNLTNEIKSDIQNLSDSQILYTNFENLFEYYYSRFYIEPLILYLDKKTSNLEQSKLKKYNPFYRMGLREQQFFLVDSCKVSYSIPFSGSSHLLHLEPTHRIISTFEIDGFSNLNNKEVLPTILYSLNIELSTLEKEENPQQYIDSLFNTEFKSYLEMIQYVNNDIYSYNSSLKDIIKDALTTRKNKANSFSNLINKLDIPLKVNPNASNIASVPLIPKKEIKSFPKQSKPEENWCISDNDYSNIKKIISQACISYEHSPNVYQKLNEEDLRDILLSNLNTHYNALATGETFSKKGKTDIRIQFENKSAYIAECKIWHGISQFKDAITQLFSYTTWRDIKTSLIIFNKEIRNFSSILSKVKNELNDNPLKLNVTELSKNEWQCTFKRSIDSSEKIELHVIICDISI